MFSLERPTPVAIERFLAESRSLALSYGPVGIARPGSATHGWDIDETVTPLGVGDAAFARAKAALKRWAHFETGWTELFPKPASTEPGADVAVLIRHLGFWSLNGSRVVYSVGDDSGPEFGFAYGTLSNHAEAGEEIFKVTIDPATGQVVYLIRAASRARAPLARLGRPVVRMLQARFRTDSGAALGRSAGERLR